MQPAPRPRAANSGTYGNSPLFIPIRADLLNSPAWLTLKDSTKCILIDFIRVFNAATNYDRDPASTTRPILYTHSLCAHPCAKNTFYRALKELTAHGFIAPSLKHARGHGQMQRWTASRAWTYYTPTLEELAALNHFNDRRAAAVHDSAPTRSTHVARLPTLNAAATNNGRALDSIDQALDAEMRKLCRTTP